MKHLYIVNPVAGRGRALGKVDSIHKAAKQAEIDYCIQITEYPGHATELALQQAQKKAARIYSVGGDGTLNEVLNGMAETNCSLGVIPAGCGNDFARSIYNTMDADFLINSTLHATPRPVDLARLNDRYFLNISSVGFDAEVAYKANCIKKKTLLPAGLSYYTGILAALGKCRSYFMTVSIDGKTNIRDEFLLAAIANGRYYGKGILPAPLAKVDDGILDMCLVRKKTRLEILRLFPRYQAGKHEGIDGVSFHRGKSIRIECNRPVAVNLDGEIEYHSSIIYGIMPAGINLLIP